jgi:succinate dehydrogenase / fumarate reductase cytochrome b subunit
MEKTLTLSSTTVGKKAIVAVSGIVLFGFVIVHMLGNLQVFAGPEALNGYARALRKVPELLWGARFVLLASVATHIWASLSLVARSSAARSVPYREKRNLATSYAARTMKWSGPLLLAFVAFHLLHLTSPGLDLGRAHDPHDVYANVVAGFQVPWVTAVYVIAQLMLGLHLHHGAWSLFQSLGLSHPRYAGLRRWVPRGVAYGVVAGNVVMPLAVLAGLVR